MITFHVTVRQNHIKFSSLYLANQINFGDDPFNLRTARIRMFCFILNMRLTL